MLNGSLSSHFSLSEEEDDKNFPRSTFATAQIETAAYHIKIDSKLLLDILMIFDMKENFMGVRIDTKTARELS